jgi:Fic family protein
MALIARHILGHIERQYRVFGMDTPWINFKVDLSKMAPTFWMLLGEARSKCDHLTNVPMPPNDAQELHVITLSKGVHATTAIEGNTLSELDVQEIVRRPPVQEAASADSREREVTNVLRAYDKVTDQIEAGTLPTLSLELIKRFNEQVLRGLEVPSEVKPGKVREHSVVVGPYRGPDADQCERLLQEMCDWLNASEFAGEGSMRIPIAIIRASLVHLYLAWIHAFGDGNGRTARLCEFVVLVTGGVPTSAAHLISNHCNNTRDEYYRQLRYASESGSDVSRFLTYCAAGFVTELREQLAVVYNRQFRLTWNEYVGTNVPGRDLDVRERRALIALTLFDHEPTGRDQITSLTAELARKYARTGVKTLARDLQELVQTGLLVESQGMYRAKTEVLLSLLPLAVPE